MILMSMPHCWCWKVIKTLSFLFVHNHFLHFLHFLIIGWVMVMNCWSTWSTPSPNQRPREPPTWCKNKVGQKYVLCNLIDWFYFNLSFDWHSRSKVETYICQKVEDSWIYNLGGGHLWVLVTQIQDSGQVVTNLSVFTSTFWLKVSAKPTKSWLFSEAVSLVSVEKISQGSGHFDSSMP